MGLWLAAKWGLAQVELDAKQKARIAALVNDGTIKGHAFHEVLCENDLHMFKDSSMYPGRAAPIDPKAIYSVQDSCEVWDGSYANYSRWRNWLCMELGNGARKVWRERCKPTDPCHDLLAFSDCEGFIGYNSCVRLLGDLETWRPGIPGVDDNGGTPWHDDETRYLLVLGRLLHGLRRIVIAGSGGLDFH